MLAEALETLRDDLAGYDQQMDAPSAENDVDISHVAALREIVTGDFTAGVPGSRYRWALLGCCRFLGEPLNNAGFFPCDTQWYFTLDEVLAEHEVPLQFTPLIFRSPVAIPESDDWPCIGHWGAAQYAAAGPLASILTQIDDPEVKSSLETALEWLQSGIDHPGSLIIGFHG